jgi:hypothetical protein
MGLIYFAGGLLVAIVLICVAYFHYKLWASHYYKCPVCNENLKPNFIPPLQFTIFLMPHSYLKCFKCSHSGFMKGIENK